MGKVQGIQGSVRRVCQRKTVQMLGREKEQGFQVFIGQLGTGYENISCESIDGRLLPPKGASLGPSGAGDVNGIQTGIHCDTRPFP